MSKIHQPGHDKPNNPSRDCETTKPEKTCPLCGKGTNELPNHIENDCEGK